MFQLPGFCFVSVSFLSYKCTLGQNLKMAGICLAIMQVPLSPFMKYELMLLNLPKDANETMILGASFAKLTEHILPL